MSVRAWWSRLESNQRVTGFNRLLYHLSYETERRGLG